MPLLGGCPGVHFWGHEVCTFLTVSGQCPAALQSPYTLCSAADSTAEFWLLLIFANTWYFLLGRFSFRKEAILD